MDVQNKKISKNKTSWITKIFILIISAFLALTFILFFSLSIKPTRQLIANFGLNFINNNLIGKVSISDFRFNLFAGIIIDDLLVSVDGDTLFFSPKVCIDWDFAPIMDKKLFIKISNIHNPKIYFVKRLNDQKWNFEKLLPSSKDTTSKPLNLQIVLENFQIENGNVLIYDHNHTPVDGKFDPKILNLSRFNLSLNGLFNFKNSTFTISINDFQCYENRIDFEIKKIIGKIAVEKNKLNVNDLAIQSKESKIYISKARIAPSTQSSHDVLKIEFDQSFANTNEVLKFTPDIFSLNNKIEFSGNLLISKDIEFENLKFKFLNSELVCNGQVILPQEENPNPNVFVNIISAKLTQNDVQSIFHPILPNLPFKYSKTTLNNLRFSYVDSEINIDGRIFTDFGKFIARFRYELDGMLKSTISFKDLDLSAIQNFPLNSTSMNGQIDLNLNVANFEKSTGNAKVYVETCSFKDYQFSLAQFHFDCKINNGKIHLDTLQTLLSYKNSAIESKIGISGDFLLQKNNLSYYKGKIEFQKIDLKSLLNNEKFPTTISGNMNFVGKESDPNHLVLDLSSKFEEFAFEDQVLFPFSLSITIDNSNEELKWCRVNSELFQVEIEGKYEFLNLFENLASQFSVLRKTFVNKFKVFQPEDTTNQLEETKRTIEISPFQSTSFVANVKIIDFSAIAQLMNLNLNFSGFARLKYVSDLKTAKLTLDTLEISYFNFSDQKNSSYILRNLDLSGEYSLSILGELPTLDYVKVNVSTNSKLVFANSVFNYFDLNLNLRNDILDYNFRVDYEGTFELLSKGNIFFTPESIKINCPDLQIIYNRVFNWAVDDTLRLEINRNGYEIQKLSLTRENAEKIIISGMLDYQDGVNSTILIKNIPLNDFQKLIPSDNPLSKISSFEGNISVLKIEVSQKLENPKIILSINAEKLKYEELFIGNILTTLTYKNQEIFGEISLKQNGNKILDIYIFELPFIIKLKSLEFNLNTDKTFKSNIIAENFPLIVASTFIASWAEQLKGYANINANIEGFLPADLKLNGIIEVLPSSLKLRANNLLYHFNGKVLLDDKTINISEIKIRNDQSDMASGEATLTGKIKIDNNSFSELSLNITTAGIKVLSRASAKSMAQLFGDLIISTSNNGITFRNNLNETRIEGSINILRGKLIMPSTTTNESISQSLFRYEFSGRKVTILEENIDTILARRQNLDINNKPSKKISNLIIDLFIGIQNPVELTIDLTSIGQIYALITLNDRKSLLHYYSDSKNNLTLVTGSDLILREGSTLKFIKIFKTSGTINFPSGLIENPSLNIKAEYSGQSIFNDAVRNYTVTIYLTGTRKNPNLRFEYTINNQSSRGDSSRITQDALYLIAFGRTRSEMEQSSSIVNLDEFSTTGGSAILSKLLSDALVGTGFISSADISFGSSTALSFDKAKLRMTGNFLGLTWNFGGTVADLMNNSELTVEIPFGLIFRPEILRNFFIQLSRTTSLNQTTNPNQKDWEVKLRYGTSW